MRAQITNCGPEEKRTTELRKTSRLKSHCNYVMTWKLCPGCEISGRRPRDQPPVPRFRPSLRTEPQFESARHIHRRTRHVFRIHVLRRPRQPPSARTSRASARRPAAAALAPSNLPVSEPQWTATRAPLSSPSRCAKARKPSVCARRVILANSVVSGRILPRSPPQPPFAAFGSSTGRFPVLARHNSRGSRRWWDLTPPSPPDAETLSLPPRARFLSSGYRRAKSQHRGGLPWLFLRAPRPPTGIAAAVLRANQPRYNVCTSTTRCTRTSRATTCTCPASRSTS